MTYLKHLQKTKMHYTCRWIIKKNKKGFIKEVKLVYNPEEYRKTENAKILRTKEGLIKLLENDKESRLQRNAGTPLLSR